ncbi:MAG: nuclear transport factor 2 family protein [Acidimicrobiales bacterium]
MEHDPSRRPRETVELYTHLLYHEGRLEALDALVSEPLLRRDPGGLVVLFREDNRRRIEAVHARFAGVKFHNLLTLVDGEYVTAVYNAWLTGRDGLTQTLSGVDVFRVVDGLIVEVWGSETSEELWG